MKAIFTSRHVTEWAIHGYAKHGLKALGYELTHIAAAGLTEQQIQNSDLIVSVGWKPQEHFVRIYSLTKKLNKPCIYISDGYLKRSVDCLPRYSAGYWAVSLNGLNSYTEIPFHEAPPDRWNKLNIELKPWKTYGNTIVIAHQHRPDWQGKIRHSYFVDLLDAASKTNHPIRIRFHPNHWRGRDFPRFPNFTFETTQARRHKNRIENDLDDAFYLATHDSNAAVDALIYGVPAMTLGRTIAFPITLNTLDFSVRLFLDRQTWANWLAYQQWTREEIETGEAFEYVLKHANN